MLRRRTMRSRTVPRRGWIAAALPVLVVASASAGLLHRWRAPHAVIDGELYRSAQLAPAELERFVDEAHVRSILALRANSADDADWDAEREFCARRGIALFHVPMSPKKTPTSEIAARLLDALDRAPRPLLVHCNQGADRTGFACVVDLVARHDWQLEHALDTQLSIASGHFRLGPTGALDSYFTTFRERAGNLSLREWIEMNARSLPDSRASAARQPADSSAAHALHP